MAETWIAGTSPAMTVFLKLSLCASHFLAVTLGLVLSAQADMRRPRVHGSSYRDIGDANLNRTAA
jgi:hypothetical protein